MIHGQILSKIKNMKLYVSQVQLRQFQHIPVLYIGPDGRLAKLKPAGDSKSLMRNAFGRDVSRTVSAGGLLCRDCKISKD